jgi:choline dehydrogenase-like flavoprotein
LKLGGYLDLFEHPLVYQDRSRGSKGLYVAGGALLPTAVDAKPVATISALSERVAEGVTGIKPDPDGAL